MTASASSLNSTVIHPSIEASLVATGLTPGSLHLDPVDLGDVDIAGVVELANIRLRSVQNDGALEEVLAPENDSKLKT